MEFIHTLTKQNDRTNKKGELIRGTKMSYAGQNPEGQEFERSSTCGDITNLDRTADLIQEVFGSAGVDVATFCKERANALDVGRLAMTAKFVEMCNAEGRTIPVPLSRKGKAVKRVPEKVGTLSIEFKVA